MNWDQRAEALLTIHNALWDKDVDSVTTEGHTFKIRTYNNQFKKYREVQLRNGWKMLSQNLAKASPNTDAVFRARAKGGEHKISWLFSPHGYYGRIDTVNIPGVDAKTTIRDLRSQSTVYSDIIN